MPRYSQYQEPGNAWYLVFFNRAIAVSNLENKKFCVSPVLAVPNVEYTENPVLAARSIKPLKYQCKSTTRNIHPRKYFCAYIALYSKYHTPKAQYSQYQTSKVLRTHAVDYLLIVYHPYVVYHPPYCKPPPVLPFIELFFLNRFYHPGYVVYHPPCGRCPASITKTKLSPPGDGRMDTLQEQNSQRVHRRFR